MPERIAVIGAGIVGICTALKAIEKGHEVWLIDPQEPGSGCSSGNAGHFATEQVFPLADPAILAKIPAMLINPLGPLAIRPRYFFTVFPWLWRFVLQMRRKRRAANTNTLRILCEAALPAWQKLLDENNLTGHLILKGSLLVFEDTPLAEIEKVEQMYRRQGVKVALLTRQALDDIEPGLAKCVNYALYFKDVGHTSNPRALSQSLTQCFLDRGGNSVTNEVTDIKQHNGSWQFLFSKAAAPSRSMPDNFHKVIICAGVYSKKLCRQLGYAVPLEAERGYHLNCKPAHMPQRPIASYERKFIMTPMAMGLRLAGTVEFAGIEAKPNSNRADGFYQHGRALWPSLWQAKDPRREENRWMGHRPSLPDSLPVISAARQNNLYFNFGHQHLGLTLAAISAEYVAQLIDKGECPEAHPLSIDRFSG